MKKLITLVAIALMVNASFSQVIFQSDLSTWSAGNPTDFFGSKTSFASSAVNQVSTGSVYGSSYANIVNTSTSHKRLTTQSLTVVPGDKYVINMWIEGSAGDVRVNYYDNTNSVYGTYGPYQTISGTGFIMYTDSITIPTGCTSIEYIISIRNTTATGIGLDSVVISGPNPPLTQIDLPVTFEGTTVDYTMTDFGGNASTLVVDPTNASNNVMRVIKTTGAQTWAGTTIGTASGFATAIPFTANDTLMTVKVWSAAAGKTVRLKVEDASNGNINCETDAVTTVAGGWDTLTFNFASPAGAPLNTANTYNMASIFFDFNTAGAQDTFYFDDVMFVTSPPPALSQIDLPVTFEGTTVDYTMTDFGGNASTLVVDPTNASNNVMRVIKTTGAQTWAGTTIGTASGFATAIPFTANDTLMTVKVWSAAAGKTVRLKVEDASNGNINCETDAVTTVAGGWDTLTFNFASPAGAPLNTANTYNMASIFFDFNTAGAQDTFYFDDVMFVTSPPPALSQIDLPVTFEGTTVDYTMTDFGGNASTLVVDPTNASNNVMRVIKTTGAQTWAGTTIGTASGFATAIPFTANDTLMTVKVWSAAAGKTVRLKVEDASNGNINCETDAVTTVAGGWDTLTFNFASPAGAPLNTANTYNMASIFFDFNTAGAQDTFYFDDVMFVTSPPPALSQIDLPVTFEGTTVDYTMTDFGGNASTLVVDPTNASNNVMRVIKTTGAQTWAGTTIGTASGFATAIPFTATDQKMTVRVWSDAAGTPVRLKVEDATAATITCETEALTVTAGGWDTLTFDFGSPATGTAALNIANTYDKASIFMDFGTAGAQDTFYFDDVMFVTSPPPALSQIDLPVTFEGTTVDYTMTDFGGNASTLVVDPTNASNNVMRVIKTTGAQTWAGTTIGTASGFATAIPFTATDQKMTVRVWSDAAGTPVRLKVEDATAATITCETEALTVTAGGWDTLTFDFGSPATGTAALNIANTYDKTSIFMDFGTAGAQDTFYFDDVMFVTSPPPALSQIDLPVTFDDSTVDYTMTDFGGNASMLMVDPTNASNNVMRVIKTTGAQTWAGTTIGTASGFATAIPFTATDQKMTVRVWSDAAGTPVRLKVEDATAATITCETEALTVTAGGWDTLTFDFGSPATGTAALNIANTYDKASIFMDFGTAGAQDTFYFDDVMFVTSPPPALSQIDLPVTFDDSTVDYTMTDFGGNASMLMVDPTNASNNVMRVIKTTGAQTWAGTTIGTASGFATAIPFTATDQKMTVRVWSDAAGTPVRLKVEDATAATITCETEALTVTAGGWDTLTFDFGSPATGTAALNIANTYDKTSIFMDFGTAGAQDTFYFDDVMFVTSPPPALSQIDLPVTFDDSTVDYTMTDFGGNASMLMVDPTNASNNVMRVIKTTGAQTWAGTTIGTASGFATAIPFTATDQKMTVRVWSDAAGTPVRLKVEDATAATITCETEALTVTAGGWDTLTFDFGSPATGTAALNIANTYDKASIFMDFGTAGAQDTFYFDDVMFVTSPPPALSQIDLPVTFEGTTVDYTMTDFGGNASTLVVDPTNASNNVMRVIKTTGAQTWAGTTIGTASGFATAIPFTATDQKMTVRVWSDAAGTPVRLKVEDATAATITCETEALTVTAGGWDTLTFDFGSPATGTAALNIANTYDKTSIFMDFGTAGAQDTFYFDDVMFVTSPPPALSQIDLPVTFDDSTVDYTMTDFGGNASMLMVDPTNASNNVMRVIKTTGAQTWAGTTIGTASGFATAIPFTATDQKMTVRVWSDAAGTPVRLKVEDATAATITCETEALTVTAGGWDTLTFDFGSPATGTAALNIANTYDKASIFMDFGTAGAQDTFYFDDVMFSPSTPSGLAQIDIPVTFDDSTVDYTMTDFGGNASMLVVDPTNATNNVMQVIKTTGAQTWAGTTIGTASGFATAIPFTATDQKMTVRVWSAAAGTPVRLKVEDATAATITCETEALTVTAGGWDTLTFDFGSPATGTAALNIANTYDKASIFMDFGTAGAQDTFYFDDVMFVTSPPPALSQIDLPVTFDDSTVDYTMTDFGGNASMLMVDPTNASNNVMRVIKTTGAQTWAGTTIGTASGFATAIPFTATDQKMTVRVWSAAAGTPVRLKVEDATAATITCETEALTVTAGGWDTLTFDFGSPATGTAALNIANTYDKASIFMDFGTAGAQDTFYFDDVMFVTSPPPALSQIDLPVTFDDSTVDYTMTDFGGNASMLMVDPTNASNNVMRVIKTTGAQTWAGTTIGTASGFATAIPFTATDQKMTVRVWSDAAGTPVRLKVEDATAATITCETEALTVTAGGWDTLTFDFGSPATGTAALNIANTYDKASIFMDFGTAGAQDTFYFDDVMFSPSTPSGLAQIDIPVTFDDSTVDYTMTDFGGNASMLVVDPTNATNNVMQVIKTTGAQTWAGTSVCTPIGMASAVPFTNIDTRISVRVWSPSAGLPIRLKVENAANNTQTCETEDTTTVVGWNNLMFDFNNPAPGTAALNTAFTFNMVSIFFDFNTAGALDTFYFDDVIFEPGISSINELAQTKLSVYPNPTDNQWTVTSENQEILSIEVYDLKGTLVFTANPTTTIVEIDGSTFNKGMYILRTTTKMGVVTSKIVKK